ncbi:hypothetical protein [Pannonibacter indicus]|uniref:hypothetical protein n=1 Tax=Pannonibacter indicus TaxID=466044 RepID=UPI0039198F2D
MTAPLTASAAAGFPVMRGSSITAWAMGPVHQTYYPGTPALAEDRVQYRFINGFVDVGDLPCRVALWEEIKTREVPLEPFEVEALNLPGFNRRVEFSSFWHRPTRLKRWLKTRLVPSPAGPFCFRLSTCGGVTIWVDGEKAVSFEPFQRNRESSTEIELSLKPEGSEVTVLTEELAERDAIWFFELTLLSDAAITAVLPVDVAPAGIAALMELATSVRPDPFHSTTGELALVFAHAPDVDVSVTALIQPSVHMRDKPPLLQSSAVLRKGETRVSLPGAEALPDAYHPLDLTFSIGTARVERHIAFATHRLEKLDWRALPLADRKPKVLEFLADHGEMRAGRAIAMQAAGKPVDATFREIIANTLEAIDERRDCSDFVMVPLLWLAADYGAGLPQDLRGAIDASVLGYRYWVDEPGNDVMWFWSENHVLCFHVSQYLAGRLYPGASFTCSGRKGAEQARLGEERLMRWFDSVEAHGLAEWNSAAYYPIDFIGLLALEHLGDGRIRERAAQLLDRLFLMIGLHTLGGVPAGTMGRAYDKELRAGPLTELAPFATLGFGEGWLNDGVAALPMLAAGSYAPPQRALDVVSPAPGTALTAHYVQGHDEAARLALYKSAHVQLSSMVDGEPGKKGHQQHQVDLRFAAHPFARAWVNHPGADDPWGGQRPSYWAGNGVMPRVGQHGNAALLVFDLGEGPRIGFTHAYVEASAFDEVQQEGNWLFLRSGAGFAALSASAPLEPVTEGPGAGIEFRAHASRCGWAALMGEAADDADPAAAFARFRSSVQALSLAFDAQVLTLTLSGAGHPSLALSWGSGLVVDGTAMPFPNRSLDPLIRQFPAVSH